MDTILVIAGDECAFVLITSSWCLRRSGDGAPERLSACGARQECSRSEANSSAYETAMHVEVVVARLMRRTECYERSRLPT